MTTQYLGISEQSTELSGSGPGNDVNHSGSKRGQSSSTIIESVKRALSSKTKFDSTINGNAVNNGLLGGNLDNTGNYMFQGGLGKSFSGAIPAKFIRTTSVRPKTLSPVWNERFRL